ncbi:DUF1993 domain-containing protein [Ponticaulis profundi]|uniref:DUF1993 family protein n=1 Tax=Ponticaulis profundi TaxID=2665222 RepID=A0ABW1SB39_9PROT
MSFSLFDATVPGYIRTLNAISGVLAKGREYYKEHALDVESIPDERLCGDMLPFSFQINSIRHHSIEAIDAIKSGQFGIPGAMEKTDYASLEALVKKTVEELSALTPDDVNACEGNDVIFTLGEMKIPFTATGFLMSFSVPNFHFHATTTYDILRMKGVPVGKRDYLGALEVKTS